MGVGVAFGLVLPMVEGPADGLKPTWLQIRAMVERAEQLGFDTVWTADEIVWRNPDWPGPRGWWECLSMTGAVSACTSMVQVGTWVMSALHHNPGMIASAAETLDEICGGRFVLGLGAGHAGGGARELGCHATRKRWRSSCRCCAAIRCRSRVSSTARRAPRCCREALDPVESR
jgi:alkanesulfonate monooxygenase SsuD/methylene tetrahydromethanopterin reductase-like flavin-dependent oxidoreductase (luciferase family)